MKKIQVSNLNNLENPKIQESHAIDEEDKKEFPKLELDYSNETEINKVNRIIITPHSINGKKKVSDRFYFGSANSSLSSRANFRRENFEKQSSDATSPNDYTFEDHNMGSHQFEILYNTEKSKYYILENRQGTGTFIKIKNPYLNE